MSVSANTLQKLMEAGLVGERLLEIVRSIEEDFAPAPRSTGAERQARYRAKQAVRNESDVTRDVTSDVTSKKEIPPTPPKEKNYTHSTADAPSEAAAYAQQIRNTFLRLRVADPELSLANAWRKAGWPIEIVCDVIRVKLEANPTGRFTLRYFERAIADAVARANAPVPVGTAASSPPRAGPAAKPISVAAQLTRNLRERNQAHVQPDNVQDPRLIDVTPLARATG